MTATVTNLKVQVQAQIDAANASTSLKDLLIIRKAAEGLGCDETNLDVLTTAKLAAMDSNTPAKDLLLGNVASDLPKMGSGPLVGSLVELGENFPDEYTDTNGHTYLKAGYYTTDTAKFDALTFTQNDITTIEGISAPFGNSPVIYGMAYGNGKYVAMGSKSGYAFIIVSEDGIKWRQVSIGFENNIYRSVHFADGKFVAVSDSQRYFFTSTDGEVWNEVAIPFNSGITYNDVTYAAGLWVAVGASGYILSSPDAVTWTVRSSATTTLNGVVYGTDRFVAAGLDGHIRYSLDGLTWTTATAGTGTNDVKDIAFGAGLFTTCATGGLIFTSPDGITWTSRTSGTALDLVGITYHATSGFVAKIISTNGVVRSMDGNIWTTITPSPVLPVVSPTYQMCKEVNGKIYMGGNSSTLVSVELSLGVGTFKSILSPLGVSGAIFFKTSGNVLLAAVTGSGIARSIDGENWTIVDTGSTVVRGFVEGNGVIIAWTNTTATRRSTDGGLTWVTGGALSGASNAIAFGNGVFVSGHTGGAGALQWSTNGASWTTGLTAGTVDIKFIVFFKNRFVFTNGSEIYYTYEGIALASSVILLSPSTIRPNNVLNVIGDYLLVGDTSTAITKDLVNFTTITPTLTTAATAVTEDFVVRSNGSSSFLVSHDDGLTWTYRKYDIPTEWNGAISNMIEFNGYLYCGSIAIITPVRLKIEPAAGLRNVTDPVKHMRIK